MAEDMQILSKNKINATFSYGQDTSDRDLYVQKLHITVDEPGTYLFTVINVANGSEFGSIAHNEFTLEINGNKTDWYDNVYGMISIFNSVPFTVISSGNRNIIITQVAASRNSSNYMYLKSLTFYIERIL